MLGLVMVTAHSATDPWPRPDSPSGHVNEMTFTVDLLPDVRRFAAAHGRGFGLDDDATVDLMIAINELATNAVRHGSPLAWLRMWSADDRMCAEIHDSGNWTPLAAPGHVPPAADAAPPYDWKCLDAPAPTRPLGVAGIRSAEWRVER